MKAEDLDSVILIFAARPRYIVRLIESKARRARVTIGMD